MFIVSFNSSSRAWVWWFTATKTVRRIWRHGSTTLSSPWSSRARSPRGAGPWWSRWPCTSSTAAVSASSSGFADAFTYWVLGMLLINDWHWVVTLLFFCLLNRFLCIVNHNFLRLQYDAHAEHTNVLDTTFKFRTDYEIIKNNTYDFMTFVQEN